MSEKKYQRVAYQSESEGESDTESKNGEKKRKSAKYPSESGYTTEHSKTNCKQVSG